MLSDTAPLEIDRRFSPRIGCGEAVADRIVRVTAPNASAYTFTGTNSFILGEDPVFLIDAGPDDAAHLAALERALDGRRVAAILLTHTHKDHSGLARAASKRFAAPLWFAGRHRRSRPLKFLEIDPLARACDWDLEPDRILKDGDRLALGDMAIDVVTTPGHCANHVVFGIVGTPYLISGDHVMGWNSTLVAVPDGSMRAYLQSLDKLADLPFGIYLPAHGGPIADGKAQARAIAQRRRARNRQILDLVAQSPKSVRALLDAVYPNLPVRNRFAARLTLGAHIEYLIDDGVARRRFGLSGRRIERI